MVFSEATSWPIQTFGLEQQQFRICRTGYVGPRTRPRSKLVRLLLLRPLVALLLSWCVLLLGLLVAESLPRSLDGAIGGFIFGFADSLVPR